MNTRESLTIPAFDDDLDDFAPRKTVKPSPKPAGQGIQTPLAAAPQPQSQPVAQPPRRSAADTRKAVDAVSRFPSREASSDGQLNLKGPQHVLDRFKAMCKSDRRAYYDMLEILMDRYEGRG
jgi:hypothetical protein